MKKSNLKMKNQKKRHLRKPAHYGLFKHLLLIFLALPLINTSFAKARIQETSLLKAMAVGSPIITSTATISGSLHNSFNFAIIATNTPTSYAATTLPAGLTLNATTGVITGTPTVSGNVTVLFTVSNASGAAKQTVVISIN